MILFPNVEVGPESTLDNFEEEVEVCLWLSPVSFRSKTIITRMMREALYVHRARVEVIIPIVRDALLLCNMWRLDLEVHWTILKKN